MDTSQDAARFLKFMKEHPGAMLTADAEVAEAGNRLGLKFRANAMIPRGTIYAIDTKAFTAPHFPEPELSRRAARITGIGGPI